MKKLNVAIIGQGRSGKDIHGVYYISPKNIYYNVKYVVETDERRREISKQRYAGCEVFASYTDLFDKTDVDIVVNASYSHMHFAITKDLLEHGFNVLVEKPFCRNLFECDTLIKIAEEKNLLLAVFQQTFFAPFYNFTKRLIDEGKFGKVEQISIRYSNFKRRWDWQTLQRMLGGNIYNTGPHPIGMALGFLNFHPQAQVVYSKLATTTQSSGDSDDYAKIIMTAPDMPVIDLEINNTDAYSDYNVKVQGSKGTFKTTTQAYKMTYIIDGENPPQPLKDTFLSDADGNPLYCGENFITHQEDGTYDGTAFDAGTVAFYEDLYFALTKQRELKYDANKIKRIIGVIDRVHADNPLQLKY
ncbi:MAG: Gfo/Idh/MocA family oxidoreductase [Clostridia bacterium]|nr:Gfo/Idh/MocA family oxidoreductase [Clostridia bacterium]